MTPARHGVRAMNGTLPRSLAWVTVAFLIPAASAHAQDASAAAAAGRDGHASRQVVIYRCTDAAGHVTIQNDLACPKGTRQQRQTLFLQRAESMSLIKTPCLNILQMHARVYPSDP